MVRILRSMLYVPANSWRMITTASGEGADAVVLDLEDACPMGEKETGRIFARDAVPTIKEHGIDVFVRVNALGTDLTEMDLNYVVTRGLDGIMLAKTESRQDVLVVDKLLEDEEKNKGLEHGCMALIPLLETPKGILNLPEIIGASQRVIAVAFGAGDFSREMGAGMGVTKLSPEEYFPMILHARSTIAMHARAAGIEAIDTPFFGLVIDLDGLVQESKRVKILGFSGKQLIHPRHVEPVNRVFAPADEDIEFARSVVDAYSDATSKGLGATTIGGRMIDYASFKRAEALLSFAEAIEKRERRKRGGAG